MLLSTGPLCLQGGGGGGSKGLRILASLLKVSFILFIQMRKWQNETNTEKA